MKKRTKKKPVKRHSVRHLTVREQVDFLANTADLKCVFLGMCGFSSKHIERETGLEPSQVSYRLKQAKVKLADYRDCTTKIARAIQDNARVSFGDFLATVVTGAVGHKVICHNGRIMLK